MTYKTYHRIALLLFFLPWMASASEIRMTETQIHRMGVTVRPVGTPMTDSGVGLPARVVIPPTQIEVVAAPLPAWVSQIRVVDGETVKKGQALARLQGAALLGIQREAMHARTGAALATEQRRRDEALFAEGIIAQSRLSATVAAERQALALADEKRQSLQLAGLAESSMLADSALLRAPFDAVVLEAAARPGMRVDAETPLFKLGRLTPLWLEIQANPQQAAGIAPGDTVTVPDCSMPARVILVAPQLQAASQSVLIRAELSRPSTCIKPFQFVQARVTSANPLPSGIWHLPTAALTRHEGRTWVFLAIPGGFQAVPVAVHGESAGMSRVAADFPADARIAIKGVAAIKAVWLGLGAGEE